MDKQAKIYVAGHRGLVGSAILKRLREGGYTNLLLRTSKELDLRRQTDTEAFFDQERPEYVFLAAAMLNQDQCHRDNNSSATDKSPRER